MRHLISIADLTRDDVERILDGAARLARTDERVPALAGKLVLTLFFESSGGSVLDSAALSPEEAAAQIVKLLTSERRGAFDRTRARLAAL